jgi:HlyD family secretion protein
MKKRKVPLLIVLAALAAWVIYYFATREPSEINLTGIVTTDEVIVSAQLQGQIEQLLVKEGDSVQKGQTLAVILPLTQQADLAYYDMAQQQISSQVKESEADLEFAKATYERDEPLYKQQAVSTQDFEQAKSNYDAALARVESLKKQVEGAAAQKKKAEVMLSYTDITAPMAAIVDTRAALEGEVVNPGQAIVTLINQDDLWVRADVEETYIDRVRLGDKLTVTLPSGATREGTVYYRGVDADFATQRDVSRTKRDIRTFEVRIRCDNSDRALAVGMTAYVNVPLAKP